MSFGPANADGTALSDGRSVLVTGATGFLGGHFALWWRRSRGEVVGLVRAETEAAALPRMLARQEESAAAYASGPQAGSEQARSNLRALAGDVARPFCGVAASRIAAARERGVDAVWHFAASLRFEPGRRDALLSQNVEGTANAIALAADLGARRFVYVSTAYSCGATGGDVGEELHPTCGPFNNAYEESKCRAEHLVLAECERLGLAGAVIRPSIVVGPAATWQPGGSEFGVYGLLKQVSRLRGLPLAQSRPIMVSGDPAARLHLVPVDHFVRECLELDAAGFPGGPVYHLTSAGGPLVGEGAAVICAALGLPEIRVGEVPERPTRVETWLGRHLGFHAPYMRFSGSFARSLPGAARLDLDDFHRLVAGYVAASQIPGAV